MSVSIPEVDPNADRFKFTSPQDNTQRFTFDTALQQRFQDINSIGDQQNQFESEQAQQRQIAAQQKAQADEQANANARMSQQQKNQQPYNASTGQPYTGSYVNSPNPRTASQAIEWAKQAAANGDTEWYRRCLAFVAQAYGLPASGTNYAIDAYTRLGANQRHDGDTNAPAGSLMFWNTGSRAGHVALNIGNGMIASNDINGKGKISIVPWTDISNRWGAKYVGWSDPSFATSHR